MCEYDFGWRKAVPRRQRSVTVFDLVSDSIDLGGSTVARVVLSRNEWGRPERLPLCCIYCGRVADGYLAKSLRLTTGGFEGAEVSVSGEAAAAGCLFGIVKWLTVGNDPVRTTRLRVNLPVCARHRRAWLVWSWFRMSLEHESLTLSGVSEEFARAVTDWRARTAGEPRSDGIGSTEPGGPSESPNG